MVPAVHGCDCQVRLAGLWEGMVRDERMEIVEHMYMLAVLTVLLILVYMLETVRLLLVCMCFIKCHIT